MESFLNRSVDKNDSICYDEGGESEGVNMARSDKRYAVYPAPKAVEILGPSCPALNQAIECWAALVARATADNAREFQQTDTTLAQFTNEYWGMDQWSLLAEVLKDMRFDPEFANPGQLLSTAIEDAHRLENIGFNCFDWGGCDSSVIKPSHIDAAVEKLVESLRQLDYVHAWAIIVAVQWFWEHRNEGIDIKKDPWWTLPFRRQWKGGQPSKQSSGGADGQQPGTGRQKTRNRGPSKGVPRTEDG
jgi:hypothetical protein